MLQLNSNNEHKYKQEKKQSNKIQEMIVVSVHGGCQNRINEEKR